MQEEITPLVLTFNEEPNIERTLAKLTWAHEIVVVDSFSRDGTVKLASRFHGTRIVERAFDCHTAQWNFGISQGRTEWVLALDADYVLSDELAEELGAWSLELGVVAYYARFRYCIAGRPLRGTLYPPRAVLFDRRFCCYEPDGHTQRLRINGKTGWLKGVIYHDDRKPFSHWLAAQDRYARLEVAKLLGGERGAGSREWGVGPKMGDRRSEIGGQRTEGACGEDRTSNAERRTSNAERESATGEIRSDSQTVERPDSRTVRRSDGQTVGRSDGAGEERTSNVELRTSNVEGLEQGAGRTEVRGQRSEDGERSDGQTASTDLRSPTPKLPASGSELPSPSPNSDLPAPSSLLSPADRIRKLIVVAPVLVFFYTLFWKRLILDGWPGLYYVFQRTLAEMILSVRLIEEKLSRKS